jgi:hypothetical protein
MKTSVRCDDRRRKIGREEMKIEVVIFVVGMKRIRR